MSLYGLVHKPEPKCQDLNWSMIRAQQLAPHGLNPNSNIIYQCDYGPIAPYTNPQIVNSLNRAEPYRQMGYPTLQCSRMGPILYYIRNNAISRH